MWFPAFVEGSCQFDAPRNFDVRQAATLKGALNPSPGDARNIVKKLRVNSDHASAHQPKRALLDAGGAHQRLLD